MTSVNPAKVAAALELADAILAEFNDPDGKVRFGVVTMEKILTYRKIAEKKPRSRSSKSADSSAESSENAADGTPSETPVPPPNA